MYNTDFFDGERMTAFVRGLTTGDYPGDTTLTVTQRVAIMTHDDYFDREMYDWEQEHGHRSTWFLLSDEIKDFDPAADLQLHYKMERRAWVGEQIDEFAQRVGRLPIANRNHRMFWRGGHLDFANLAMHGIRVDSTLGHDAGFRPCVDNRLLPIWELPYSVADPPHVDATRGIYPTYNTVRPMRDLFRWGCTPLVGLFHPQLKNQTDWKRFYEYADCYGYRLMTVSEFHAEYLPC